MVYHRLTCGSGDLPLATSLSLVCHWRLAAGPLWKCGLRRRALSFIKVFQNPNGLRGTWGFVVEVGFMNIHLMSPRNFSTRGISENPRDGRSSGSPCIGEVSQVGGVSRRVAYLKTLMHWLIPKTKIRVCLQVTL